MPAPFTKGRGKTVEEAYVLHSPLMTQNLSYVALTRQVKEVHLYVSKDEAKAQEDLVAQMSKSDARVVSLGFLTAQQLEKEQKIQESFVHKMAYGVGDSVRGVIQRFTDHLPNQSFYHLSALPESKGSLVREQNALEKWKAEKITSSSPKKGYTQSTQKESRDVLESKGKDRIRSSIKRDDSVKSQSSPSRADLQREETILSSKNISSSKTSEPNPRELKEQTLSSLQKAYKQELVSLYRAKIGDKYKDHLKIIDQAAGRAAENAFIRGIPESQKLRQINLSRANYEVQRLPKLKENLIKEDPKFVDNWMSLHLKAEALVQIEGKLFGILRSKQSEISMEDKKLIQKEAPKHLKEHEAKVKNYASEAVKDYNYSETQARMFAQQKALFEQRFGMKPNEMQEQALKSSAELGCFQYGKYKAQYESQQTNKHGKLDDRRIQYIDQAAFYKAYHEAKEILIQSFSKSDPMLSDSKELLKIEKKIEKEFRADKNQYDNFHREQQKQLEQKQIQTQQWADRDRDMSL